MAKEPERKRCTFPGCTRYLSQYNKTPQCLSHTASEIQIERRRPLGVMPTLACAPVPQKPRELRPFTEDIPMYRRILLATSFHAHVSENVLTGKSRNGDLPKYRMIAMYLLKEHTKMSEVGIGRLLKRIYAGVVKDAVEKITANEKEYAGDIAAIRKYCGISEVRQKEAAE